MKHGSIAIRIMGLALWIVSATHTVGAMPALFGSTAQDVDSVQDADPITLDLEMPLPENSEQVTAILQRIEENAIDIRESASRLLTFNRVPLEYSWLTHAWRLNRAKERLQDIEMMVDRLNERPEMLLDGQRKALDFIRPQVEMLRAEIDRAIAYIDAVRNGERGSDYTEMGQSIRDNAQTIIDGSRLAESLGNVRKHLEMLESVD